MNEERGGNSLEAEKLCPHGSECPDCGQCGEEAVEKYKFFLWEKYKKIESGFQESEVRGEITANFWQEEIKRLPEESDAPWRIAEYAMNNSSVCLKSWCKGESIRDYDPKKLERMGMTLSEAREKIPFEIGERFNAHGIAKMNQLKNLRFLLERGVDLEKSFHFLKLTSRYEAQAAGIFGFIGHYNFGSFIVISGPDRMISESGIRVVAVNYDYRDSIKLFQKNIQAIC